MIFDQVVSIDVDSFHWYRNDSIGGDTFDIDSMTTNTSAPFQIAVQIEKDPGTSPSTARPPSTSTRPDRDRPPCPRNATAGMDTTSSTTTPRRWFGGM